MVLNFVVFDGTLIRFVVQRVEVCLLMGIYVCMHVCVFRFDVQRGACVACVSMCGCVTHTHTYNNIYLCTCTCICIYRLHRNTKRCSTRNVQRKSGRIYTCMCMCVYVYTHIHIQIASQHEKALYTQRAARERVERAHIELAVECQQMIKWKKILTLKQSIIKGQQVRVCM